MQIDDVNAIKQIGAEGAVLYLLFQLAVGCADHADFDLLVLLRPNPAELTILQQLQQLRLQGKVKLGNLVEKQRPTVCHLHAARLGAVGASERASFVAKQFALQQRTRNRWTIHFHPRPHLPRGCRMDHARNDVLARAALSLNQHRDVCTGQPRQTVAHSLHRFHTSKHHRLRGILPQWLDQRIHRTCGCH